MNFIIISIITLNIGLCIFDYENKEETMIT